MDDNTAQLNSTPNLKFIKEPQITPFNTKSTSEENPQQDINKTVDGVSETASSLPAAISNQIPQTEAAPTSLTASDHDQKPQEQSSETINPFISVVPNPNLDTQNINPPIDQSSKETISGNSSANENITPPGQTHFAKPSLSEQSPVKKDTQPLPQAMPPENIDGLRVQEQAQNITNSPTSLGGVQNQTSVAGFNHQQVPDIQTPAKAQNTRKFMLIGGFIILSSIVLGIAGYYLIVGKLINSL